MKTETLKFNFSSEELVAHVPSLAALKFATNEKINLIGKTEGALYIIAIREISKAICIGYKTMEILFSTGYVSDEKNKSTIKTYTYSFEYKEEKVTNFKDVKEIKLDHNSTYFIRYSEDVIYTK